MLNFGNIGGAGSGNSDSLFESHSSEEINLKINVILNEPLDSIPNGDHVVLDDEMSSISLEECIG